MSGKADIRQICENNSLPVYDLYSHLHEDGKRTVVLCFAGHDGKYELTAPTNGRLKKKLISYLNRVKEPPNA